MQRIANLKFRLRKGHNKAQVLEYINAVRAEFFLEPLTELPAGQQGWSHSCVVAKGLDELNPSVAQGSILLLDTQIYNPPVIVQFISDFDRGKYPELIA